MILNQVNLITFVLVDNTYTEVAGVGDNFTIEISKAGGPFVAGVGAKAEIGDGWYSYILTAAECDTVGPLSVMIPANLVFSYIQQNLEYIVLSRAIGCRTFTYTVIDSVTLLPVEDVEVWFSTDFADPPANVVWYGTTDAFGIARDVGGNIPCLDDGTYAVWKQKVGYTPVAWPDTEIVGP